MSEDRVKPAVPGGFNDFAPGEALERETLLADVLKTFRSFGFVPLETSSVEFKEVLVGQAGETEKEIFELKGSDEDKTLALRFDLTVGLARYVASHPELQLPFKRYQTGAVFRGEKPQAGRYRQFMQMDIDVVGAGSVMAEAELFAAMNRALKVFDPGKFYFKINHRGMLEGLCKKVGIREREGAPAADQAKQLMRILDKLEKIGMEEVFKELTREPKDERDLAPNIAEAGAKLVADFVSFRGGWKESLTRAADLLGDTEDGAAAIEDLTRLGGYLALWGLTEDDAKIDFSVARGLDYYTGVVFETALEDNPGWGSVMSGGRYDALVARFSGQKIPAVGGSIGFDRLYRLVSQRREKTTQSEVDAVVMLFEDRFLPQCVGFVRDLQRAGLRAEIPLTGDRSFKGQMNYGLKRGAKYLIIYGDGEEAKNEVAVKNTITRKQKSVPINENWANTILEIF